MRLPPERPLFQPPRYGPSPYRLLFWAALIAVGIFFLWGLNFSSVVNLFRLQGFDNGRIQPIFQFTPTPTRTALSFAEEGEAYFNAGNLGEAINAFQEAIELDPDNVLVLTQLARIETYSAGMLTLEPRIARLADARAHIAHAVEVDPSDSNAYAVQALVLDWTANLPIHTPEEREALLADALQSAIRSTQLDSQNALALAFRAEALADQLQWTEARQLAELAVSRDPNIMDTHRVYAYVLESSGFYSRAIEEYQAAAEITPNLTFLYISIGQNYRQLELFDQALDYFDRAASINETLGIQDPLPFIAIAKTYSRMGEFFIAARNAERAIAFDPADPDLYGQLGIIYFRSRNYEGSVLVLKCAVQSCTAEENELEGVAVAGLSLTDGSVVYYYTYGSVLAALNMCDLAIPILEQVNAVYRADPTISSIVQESLFICTTFTTTSTPAPLSTSEDMMGGTPVP